MASSEFNKTLIRRDYDWSSGVMTLDKKNAKTGRFRKIGVIWMDSKGKINFIGRK